MKATDKKALQAKIRAGLVEVKNYDEAHQVVEQIAADYGLAVRSVIGSAMFLTRGGAVRADNTPLWQAKPYKGKTGQTPVKKNQLIGEIAKSLQLPEESVESLRYVSKGLLFTLSEKLKGC